MSQRTDPLTPEQRSKLMSAVRSKDTSLEKRLRKALWSRGHRYRKNYKKASGTPDIAFIGLKIAIFCDSEFWHGHNWETRKNDFKSNQSFWIAKIERNIERDKEVNIKLHADGWKVIRFWGKEIKKDLDGCVKKIESVISKQKNVK